MAPLLCASLGLTKMERVLDHFLYVLELHANNEFIVYTTAPSRQIPQSFAANAFNVLQHSVPAEWSRQHFVSTNSQLNFNEMVSGPRSLPQNFRFLARRQPPTEIRSNVQLLRRKAEHLVLARSSGLFATHKRTRLLHAQS